MYIFLSKKDIAVLDTLMAAEVKQNLAGLALILCDAPVRWMNK